MTHGRAPIPILSFFTGGGFLDLGFEQAGFHIAWTNEVNPAFADMYEHGISAVRRSRNPASKRARVSARVDITSLTKTQILGGAFGAQRPQLFGVIGGPPCPDFSNGGKHKGQEGDHGKLSKAYIDLVCALKPGFFVMENVPGLFRNRRHRLFLAELREQLRQFGFVSDVSILNALEFGVPQDRPRLFMIGLRGDVFEERFKGHEPPICDGWFPFPQPPYPGAKKYDWPRISAFGEQPSKPSGIPESLMVCSAFNGSVPLENLPNGKEGFVAYSSKVGTVAEGDVTRKSFKRLHRYRYSPTACYGNNEVHLHPWEARRLTVREALRLQSVPDTYELPSDKTLSAKFKMIANGVPVELARHIGQRLFEVLNQQTSDLFFQDRRLRTGPKNGKCRRKTVAL